MRIGIISNNDNFIPFAHALLGQNIPVQLYYSPSPDSFVNQKIDAFAAQFSLSVKTEKTAADLYSWLNAGKYDVCFMLGYPHLIDVDKTKQLPTKLYNIHSGSLPAFRGPTPVFWQLKKGMPVVGVTIHEVSKKFDDGTIVWLKEIPNLPHYNYELVNQLMGQVCTEGVFYILQLLLNKMPVPAVNRVGVKSGYQKRPTLADISINWQQMPAQEICDLIRACNPWNKGATTTSNGQELKLMDAQIVGTADASTTLPGTIVNDNNCLHVLCCDSHVIGVNMVFLGGFYVPAYQAKVYGLVVGEGLV